MGLLTKEQIRELIKEQNMKTTSDISAMLKDLTSEPMQEMLEVEMDTTLGYGKNENSVKQTGNRRNRHRKKTVVSKYGDNELLIPRDCEGENEPLIIKKHQKNLTGIEEQIIVLYSMCPVICMDEQPYQLLDHIIEPLPMKKGSCKKDDYEYERKGTCCIFMFTEPLSNWRHVNVRHRRTKMDWVEEIQELLDIHYPLAEKIILVMDNLNTHTISSLYESFAPAKARALAERLEIHYTSKHGSWLDIAEIELNVMTRQYLNRRISDMGTLQHQVDAWSKERNASQTKVAWQFKIINARIKLKHLCPKMI